MSEYDGKICCWCEKPAKGKANPLGEPIYFCGVNCCVNYQECTAGTYTEPTE